MNKDLLEIFENHSGRLVRKWMHYFDVYENHFGRFRDSEITILEIGVCDGGSLQMWREYFGPKAKIIGVDLDPRCKAFEDDGIEIYIGSQDDRKFLRELKSKIPKVDILLDDGGHTMSQQIATFEELFDHVKDDGVYLCEDMHTSYWPLYGGGHKIEGTFIEYCKGLVDQLNAWHGRDETLSVDQFTESAVSMHFYDSITAIEKSRVRRPHVKGRGKWNYTPKDLENVLAIYDKEIIGNDSTPLWMLSNYGDALTQAGRLKDASNVFNRCLDIKENAWSIHLKLGQVALKSNNYRLAIEHCNSALDQKPALVPALLTLAEANAALANKAASRNYLQEVLNSNPGHKGATRLLSTLSVES